MTLNRRLDRRKLLSGFAATPLAFGGLRRSLEHGLWTGAAGRFAGLDPERDDLGFGALQPDAAGLLDLPRGFTYRVLSKWGERMDDGLLVPASHDGMAALQGPRGLTVLIRNHELGYADDDRGAFGPGHALDTLVDAERIYDRGQGDGPTLGGTSTIVYDTRSGEVVRHYLSLAGTARNCAGGPTPWNTWITCEETVVRTGDGYAADHGWNFEVPARLDGGLCAPVPLKAMGRFNHEAVAVDPRTGIVHQTEDRPDSLLYRFVPKRPGHLQGGGRLQALVIADGARTDTRNWGEGPTIERGQTFRCTWVDLDDPESPADDLRKQGADAKGCALFARGEGMWWAGDALFFTCTSGGTNKKGQIWRYAPDAVEADADPAASGGTLELWAEPRDEKALDNCDNLTVSPWGDLIVCEDGPGEQFLVGVAPDGRCYPFARNAKNGSEFAGATFSPDGTTLFANIQGLGVTVAITGPWKARQG